MFTSAVGGHDSPQQMKNELFAFIFLLNRAYHHHFKHSLSTLFSGSRSFQPVGFLLVAVLDLFAGFSWQREITQHNLLSIQNDCCPPTEDKLCHLSTVIIKR